MALLPILHFPDPRLRTVAKPVAAVDARVCQLIKDMFATMYQAPGIGLAATQVNVHERVIVMDVSREGTEPLVFINPEILHSEGTEEMQEGCLSVPDVFENVTRAEKIRVRALNEHGEIFERDCDGLLAVCVQHEMDHLNGKLFVDYLSGLKRERIRKKAVKKSEAITL